MMRAIWNGVVIAEAPRTKRVEGNDYFPHESLKREYFEESSTKSLCPWKGMARYYTLTVDGLTNPDAGWYYPHPSPLARPHQEPRRLLERRHRRRHPRGEAAAPGMTSSARRMWCPRQGECSSTRIGRGGGRGG